MRESQREGVTYEIDQSHGGDYWVPVIHHGPTAADTQEQAMTLLMALRKKRFTDAPLLRIVRVQREVTDCVDFRRKPTPPTTQPRTPAGSTEEATS